MIGRVLLAAVLAGLAAGFVMGLIQHVRLTPMILHAETFEHTAHGHAAAVTEDHSVAEHDHDGTAWKPADGTERTFFTIMTAMLTAAGFALALVGVSFLTNIPITRENGVLWGLCGFLAVAFAPSVGLPPELPGMPAGSLNGRQFWWIFTILCTGSALWIIATRKTAAFLAVAAGLALLPHVIGAPQPANLASAVPAGLAAEFATSSLAANLLMWLAIGGLLPLFLKSADHEAPTQ
jgi:cobalt transporter subunit CbtA